MSLASIVAKLTYCCWHKASFVCLINFQVCECHVFDIPSPEAHYKAVCRSLVEEAMSIQGLREMDTGGREKDKKKIIVS